MKLAIAPALATLLLVSAASGQTPATRPASVCLNVSNIQRSEIPDDQTILFHMRDGKIWRNRLRTVCPMLKTSSYTQKLNGDLMCSNAQFIHVNMTGNDCVLGDFTLVAPQN